MLAFDEYLPVVFT